MKLLGIYPKSTDTVKRTSSMETDVEELYTTIMALLYNLGSYLN